MPAPAGYIDVASRIAEFRAKHPEGTLRPADPSQPFQMVEVNGSTFVVVCAAAFRHPDDPAPGIGTAWEPVPGLTNFTRNSELQNAETSAWGRALIAVGAADSKQGVASAEDVQNRQAEEAYYQSPEYAEEQAIPGLRTSLQAAIDKHLGDPEEDPLHAEKAFALKAWFAKNDLPPVKRMNAAQCEKVIDYLMGPEAAVA